jgi:small conductance mechanosensitive channel
MGTMTHLFEKITAKVTAWAEAAVVMLPNFGAAVLVVLIGAVVSKWAQRVVRRLLQRPLKNSSLSDLLSGLVRLALMSIALFVALGMLNLDKAVTSLLAGVGVVGLALGFAFQDIAANFMSGIIMAVRRPFYVGDQVEIAGHHGKVQGIQMRATALETLDGLDIQIPNKDVFQNAIINYTKTDFRRVEISVGTAYGNDMETVRRIILEAVRDVPLRDSKREPEVFFTEFGDSSINSEVRIWITESIERSYKHVHSEAMIAIKKAFDKNGITIPFPIRTLDFGAGVVGGERLDDMHVSFSRKTHVEK